MAKIVVANDNNKLSGLQFRMPKLDSSVASRKGVTSASGNSHDAANVMFACADQKPKFSI
jgi:hypothetical protein